VREREEDGTPFVVVQQTHRGTDGDCRLALLVKKEARDPTANVAGNAHCRLLRCTWALNMPVKAAVATSLAATPSCSSCCSHFWYGRHVTGTPRLCPHWRTGVQPHD
jgi:hypothetical protein